MLWSIQKYESISVLGRGVKSNEVEVRTGYMLKNFICYAEVFGLNLTVMKKKHTGRENRIKK